jgi:hypothetical protein
MSMVMLKFGYHSVPIQALNRLFYFLTGLISHEAIINNIHHQIFQETVLFF